MDPDAIGRIVGLAGAIVLATGCSRAAVGPRDATAMRAPADGVANAQPASAAPPATVATGAPPATDATTAPPASAAPPVTDATAAPEADRPPETDRTEAAARTEAGTDGSVPGHDPHRWRRVLGWVSLSIGAEAAAVAIVTSLLIEHQKSVRDENCSAQKVCNEAGFNAVTTIDTIVPWNTVTWIVAAAGLGAGTVLLITSPSGSEHRTALTLSPNSSGLGLGVRSTF
jgi:hypothetical protein